MTHSQKEELIAEVLINEQVMSEHHINGLKRRGIYQNGDPFHEQMYLDVMSAYRRMSEDYIKRIEQSSPSTA